MEAKLFGEITFFVCRETTLLNVGFTRHLIKCGGSQSRHSFYIVVGNVKIK